MTAPLKVYWHKPAPIFEARVNMPGTISYPLHDLAYDGVTTGAYTDLHPDMFFTLGSAPGDDSYGRGRLRATPTSTILKVGRASQGHEDGELYVVDNAYISVYDDYRVHSKIPRIGPAPDYIEYKDADIAVGDHTQKPPPVANADEPDARVVDADTGTIVTILNGAGSYAMADGATITNYQWDVADGTIVFGGAPTDATIFVEFPAGFRWISLTVTDSNGKTHTTRRFILAEDPANSICVSGMQVVNITRDQQGSRARLRVLDDLPRDEYPDGALVVIFEERDPAIYGSPDPALRDHLLFWGWHQTDRAGSRALETHLQRETELTCVDVAGRLDSLPGFPQRLELPDDVVGLTWGEMPAPNMDKFLHYLIHWHSTAASLTDFYTSGTGADYAFVIFDAVGDTLYNQLSRQAQRMVPDYAFTCDRYGALRVVPNPQYQNVADRTATIQNSATEQNWSEIDFGYQRSPRVHTLRASALLVQAAWETDGDGNKTLLPPVFAVAPGTSPGQGAREQTLGERLAPSQQALNDVAGHHLARMNARYSEVTVTLNSNSNPWSFDPSAYTWVQLMTTAATAPHRGLDFTTVRALCREVSVDYVYREEATLARGRVTLELETSGLPAVTEEHEEALPPGEQPAPWTPPLPGDESVYYGNMAAYVLWDGEHVFRTMDLQAASPTWEFIGTGITGTIRDCQYFHPDANTVGAWLLSSDGVFLCLDLLAASPTWTNPLTIAEIRAQDAVPSQDSINVGAMAHYWLQPGHLCVATQHDGGDAAYAHAYFWVTEDYGATWTQVDMNAFLFTSNGFTRGYTRISPFGMAAFRSEPIIWAVRNTIRTPSTGNTGVFKSIDGGYTWTMEHDFAAATFTAGQASILHPFPDITSASYIVGAIGTSAARLYKSTDAWDTATLVGIASGYNGAFGYGNVPQRPNKRTFDNTHVIMLWNPPSTSAGELLESYDQGATWTLLKNGLSNGMVTPGGWPPDVQQWTLIDHASSLDADTIRLTLDNFTTLSSKTGNLATVLSGIGDTWNQGGYGGGYALPRIGINGG